jgi:hypothetical protein
MTKQMVIDKLRQVDENNMFLLDSEKAKELLLEWFECEREKSDRWQGQLF